jgi:5-methylthioadenosine/S-adenosylhomocysteine deaminase
VNTIQTANTPDLFCLSARFVVPVDPKQARILHDTAIVVKNNKIQDLLPIQALPIRYPTIVQDHFPNHLLLPGFINSHTHTPMNLLKGYADDLALMHWLKDHIWPVENYFLSPQFAYDGAVLAIDELIKSGVTCFNDMYFYTQDIARAAVESGIRACVGTHIFEPPTPFAPDAAHYLDQARQLCEIYHHHPLIKPLINPHAPYTVSDETFQKAIALSARYDTLICTHLHETESEILQSLQTYGVRPLARLEKLGLFDRAMIAIHMANLIPEEIALCQKYKDNVGIVHCPESNLKLSSGFCPVNTLLKQGNRVGLGTDSAASNNDLDMISEMHTAALLGKAVAQDPTALSADRVLNMATQMGADILCCGDRIGSLTIGKEADIIAIDLKDSGSQPIYDPISTLIYSTTRQQVTDVWIQGHQQLKQRKRTNPRCVTQHNDILTHWTEKISHYARTHTQPRSG